MNFKFRITVILILLLASAQSVFSRIYIIHSFEYEPFHQISEGISTRLQDAEMEIVEIFLDGDEPQLLDDADNLCITLGEKAFSWAQESTEFIPLMVMMNYNVNIPEEDTSRIITVIPPDIKLMDKCRILKDLLVDMKGVVVPCTKEWHNENKDDLKAKLDKIGIDLRFVMISGDVGVFFRKLSVPAGYILMAVDDSKIYNRSSIYNILELTFKKRIPFIGLTRGFVKSGAYLSVVPDYFSMGSRTGDLVRSEHHPATDGSPEYSVFVNVNIMKLVNMKIARNERVKFLR